MANKKNGDQTQNKQIIIVSIAIIAAIVIIALGVKFLGNGDEYKALYKGSPVIGKVDGKPVYQQEADDIVKSIVPPSDGKQLLFTDLDENSKEMIIREIAAQRAMANEAKAKGITESDEIKRKVYEYKNKLIRDQLLAKYANADVTPEKLKQKYDEIEAAVKGKSQMKVSHILLTSEKDAAAAESRLKKEPFAKVAKEMSQDPATKVRGGDLGYLVAGTMDPDFEKAALSLKEGEVSGPVKTKFGWHIIKLEDKKAITVPPFEAIKGRLAQDIYSESLKKYADDLLANVKYELVESEKAKEDPKKEEKAEEAKPAEDKPAGVEATEEKTEGNTEAPQE